MWSVLCLCRSMLASVGHTPGTLRATSRMTRLFWSIIYLRRLRQTGPLCNSFAAGSGHRHCGGCYFIRLYRHIAFG